MKTLRDCSELFTPSWRLIRIFWINVWININDFSFKLRWKGFSVTPPKHSVRPQWSMKSESEGLRVSGSWEPTPFMGSQTAWVTQPEKNRLLTQNLILAQHSQCFSIAGLSPAVTPQLSCFIHLLIFLSKFQKIKSVRWGFRITRPMMSQVQNKIISY